MAMRNPPHPGGIVRRQCLDPLDLSVTEAAKGLGVTRQALSDLVNGKAGISIDMAIRLSKAFGSSPETWLGMQMAYDLWQARSLKVRHFKAAWQSSSPPGPPARLGVSAFIGISSMKVRRRELLLFIGDLGGRDGDARLGTRRGARG